uniref:Glycosyltransferase family 92 protein n=1 Tax=Rhabditophanes sp. KR3021 TaxID=114890 RepID=A0AC35U9A9_9BILA
MQFVNRLIKLPTHLLTIVKQNDETRKLRFYFEIFYKIALIAFGIILGFTFYYRTTNIWMLKNLGDSWLSRQQGLRPIVIGAFHRADNEKNSEGDYAVIQYIANSYDTQKLYCISKDLINGEPLISTALIQRIHGGKRNLNDVCSWSGHLAECQIASANVDYITLSTSPDIKLAQNGMQVNIERPITKSPKEKLVVCIAPMYIYSETSILLTGIESWLALGASKIIIPIQSASNTVMNILRKYEKDGKVILRHWPKWPVMNDVNPNGLVLSRGIEESHVNCLHFAKPFADLIAFSDIDDILLPKNPQDSKLSYNLDLLYKLFGEHPNAGTLLFEHRDVQLVLPKESDASTSLSNFNFNFLHDTKRKQSCHVWRMKTRVIVNASRVDTVLMHESGINKFGYAQVRLPCRQAHFYHLRHSFRSISSDSDEIEMTEMVKILNGQFANRLSTSLSGIANLPIYQSSFSSFRDFDECVMAVTDENFSLKVSRCMTPSACFVRHMPTNMNCTATHTDFSFARIGNDFISASGIQSFIPSSDCDAPVPKFNSGNSYYLP